MGAPSKPTAKPVAKPGNAKPGSAKPAGGKPGKQR